MNTETDTQHFNRDNTRLNPVRGELDIYQLWMEIKKYKWKLLIVFVLSLLFSGVISSRLPIMYKSEIKVYPAELEKTNLPLNIGGISNLASLAGIRIGARANYKTRLALEIIKSKNFIGTFIREKNYMVPLMAGSEWDKTTNSILINSNVYDEKSQTWPSSIEAGYTEPTNLQIQEKFVSRLSLNEDEESKVITISYSSLSPLDAQECLTNLIDFLNDTMRKSDLVEAESNIEYIRTLLESTNVLEIQNIFYDLIKENTKTVMLAKLQKEYIFRTVDPAYYPENPSYKRKFIVLLAGTFIPLLFSIIIITIMVTIRRDFS